jgi:DNA-binding NtrC family response regulator
MRVTRVTNQMLRQGGVGAAYLRVLGGPDAGLEVALPPIGVVVGADPSVDVVLTDPAVSSRHCTVIPGADGFEVRDLGSRNGTLLDGVALSQARVPVGAILRVGTSLLQLMPAEDAVDIPPSQRTSFGGLVGGSLAMRRVYAVLERAAQSQASILFLGESGTGKELAARAVHEHSPRKAGPLVVFDCGAASETLIASDLFGHVRGAFTGAQSDRVGAFAAADAGTLFLDEIGDLPLPLQPKLLRMLEAGEVVPLGGRAPERHDVRVVAATHRDLYTEVGEGGFRGDLYYRLAVVEVYLPPLRQRGEDIPELVRLFLSRAGSPITEVGGRNLERLIAYHWPGNVRELRNVITRAVALAPAGARFDDLPIMLRPSSSADAAEPAVRADRPYHDAKEDLLRRFDADYLGDLMRRAAGNVSQAARLAGLERKYLYKLLERAGLRSRKPDDPPDEGD